jgi:hypothetical protein
MSEEKIVEMWQRAAREFGAEACANGRKYMNNDDRVSIAYYHSAKTWNEMTEHDRDEAMRLFSEGYEAERATL